MSVAACFVHHIISDQFADHMWLMLYKFL